MNSGDEWSVMNNLFSEGAADHSCALDTVFSPAGLLNVILRFWKLILLFVLLGGLAAWGLTRYVIKPVYRANATIYAWNNTQGANGNASTQEFYLVTQLMNDYRELLTSRRVQQPVEASLKTAFAVLTFSCYAVFSVFFPENAISPLSASSALSSPDF